ncbi:uncharacterized protein F4812DRAFT_460697 [Daldinia caldariorum]|uniref:uncharacterized protein n=1 Tax=Daldinia caldariorum TaxID=326644 RepID=UPI0020084A9A|nr:uncharacterized protein F4812DRAFT_460697 [Daldinia caldariorum]KAI1466425.1 hypothetical protein F4812DRAFT_460697 [Daldinia caldariorum]
MNPYESDPSKIPSTDRYADVPLYGRYSPRPTDFKPDAKHINVTTQESLNYWSTVLAQCTEHNRIYENDEGGRDVFALGSVIIKSSHLKPNLEGRRAYRDYSYADANEAEAIRLARNVLGDIKVSKVYFASEASFKEQARQMLKKLGTVIPPSGISRRSYIVPDPDPIHHRGIQEIEEEIILAGDGKDTNLSFMHNDVLLSNCIVDNDKIVGLVDWEMAGYFGWKTAADIHVRIRTPKRENFTSLNLPEDVLHDILFWNDLYDV